ncbi:MAG: hypothetical protein K6F09_00695 [Clostridiales bacterium]|nr:hypothetical protein [Clostridiales bacterium]
MSDKVVLSTLTYYTQGNVTTGSCTPERLTASPLADVFCYRALTSPDDKTKLAAEYYIGHVCFELADRDAIVSDVFDLSDEGVEKAREFLQKGCDKFFEDAENKKQSE